MAVRLQFEIEGEKQVSAVLGIAADKVKDFREPMGKIAANLDKTWQQNFSSRGALFHTGGWPPRKSGGSWPLLEKTGRMRASFRDRVHKDYVVLWNDAPYFMYHQSNQPRSRLPRRIMMKIDQERRNMIFKTIQEYIVRVTRGRG